MENNYKCKACGNTEAFNNFLPEGTWMGTKKLPSEFFRSSEYDFGWDYYPRKDTLQSTCKECGYVQYSVIKE